MTSLLHRIMEVTGDNHPITVCAVCCAVITIMHRRMNEDNREAARPLISRCLSEVVHGQDSEWVH